MTNSTLREIEDIDITLVMETKDRTTTVKGKARSVAFDTDNHYDNEYYMDTAFPRSYLSSQSAKTTVDWQYDDGKLYSIKVKKKNGEKMEVNSIQVATDNNDVPDEYEARGGAELKFGIVDNRLYLWSDGETFAIYEKWNSVNYV